MWVRVGAWAWGHLALGTTWASTCSALTHFWPRVSISHPPSLSLYLSISPPQQQQQQQQMPYAQQMQGGGPGSMQPGMHQGMQGMYGMQGTAPQGYGQVRVLSLNISHKSPILSYADHTPPPPPPPPSPLVLQCVVLSSPPAHPPNMRRGSNCAHMGVGGRLLQMQGQGQQQQRSPRTRRVDTIKVGPPLILHPLPLPLFMVMVPSLTAAVTRTHTTHTRSRSRSLSPRIL